MPHKPLPTIDLEIEKVAIRLYDKIIIREFYNQPRHRLTERDLTRLTTRNKLLLIGDANARLQRWYNSKNNKHRTALFDFTTENNITVLARNVPTHYLQNGGTPTYIDLTINKNIKLTRKTKYLGVTFNSMLRYQPHVSNIVNKTYMPTTKLYPLINRRNALSTQTKLLLYKTVIRPTIAYAAPAWNIISSTLYARLQRTQNKLLLTR